MSGHKGSVLYLMIIGRERRWLSLSEAGLIYDSGWTKVHIGGTVLNIEDGTEREITDEEKKKWCEHRQLRYLEIPDHQWNGNVENLISLVKSLVPLI